MTDIFISYSRKDSDIVNKIVSILEKEGYSVWIDKNGIESGDQFKLVIVEAIEDSRVVLFFSSEASNASSWTAKEIGIANARSKPIIPIKLDHSSYNRQVEFDLINNDYVDLSEGLGDDAEMKKLLRSVARKCKDGSESFTEVPFPSKQISRKKKSRKLLAILIPILVVLVVAGLSIYLGTKSNHASIVESEIPQEQIDSVSYSVPVTDESKLSTDIVRQAPSEKKVDAGKEFKVGYDLFTGNGVDIDYEEAFKHLKIAADAGHAEAQYVVGRMYYHGILTSDYSKAVKYFKMSSAQGHACAPYFLAQCYLFGWGVHQDDAKGIEYLKKSADLGAFQARSELAGWYSLGKHVEKDLDMAEFYCKMAKQSDSFNVRSLPGYDDDSKYLYELDLYNIDKKLKEIQKERSQE